MQANVDRQSQGEQVSWWFRFLTRVVGVIGGIVAMVTGVIVAIAVHPICILAGVMQVCAGCIAVAFEAPCCCPFLDFIDKIGQFSETRPHWQKAALYCVIALFPIALCFGPTTIFGSGLVFVTGVLYGLMFIGKKADKNQMLTKARDDMEMKSTLIESEEQVSLHVPDGQDN